MAEGDVGYVLITIYADLDDCVTGAARYVLSQDDGHITVNIGIEDAAGIQVVHHPDANWSTFQLLENWDGTLNSTPDGDMETESSWYGFHFKGRLASADQPTFNNGSTANTRTRIRFHGANINTYNAVDSSTGTLDLDSIIQDTISGVDYIYANELGNHAAWSAGEENIIAGIADHICPDTGDGYDDLVVIIFDPDVFSDDEADALLLAGAQSQGSGSSPSGEEDLGSLYFGGGYTGGNLGKGLGKGFVARW